MFSHLFWYIHTYGNLKILYVFCKGFGKTIHQPVSKMEKKKDWFPSVHGFILREMSYYYFSRVWAICPRSDKLLKPVVLTWGIDPGKKPTESCCHISRILPPCSPCSVSSLCLSLLFSLCHSHVHTRFFSLCYLSVGF